MCLEPVTIRAFTRRPSGGVAAGIVPDPDNGKLMQVKEVNANGQPITMSRMTGNSKLIQVKAVKGILHTTTKLRESKTYTVKNRNDMEERTVLIEHPVRNAHVLIVVIVCGNEIRLLALPRPLRVLSGRGGGGKR